jgi:uncharacterized membrane protein
MKVVVVVGYVMLVFGTVPSVVKGGDSGWRLESR